MKALLTNPTFLIPFLTTLAGALTFWALDYFFPLVLDPLVVK